MWKNSVYLMIILLLDCTHSEVNTEVEDDDKSLFLIGEQYEGTYVSEQSGNLFEYLDSQTGTIDVLFFNDPFKKSSNKLNTLIIVMLDPVYNDRKAVRLVLDLDSMVSKGVWQGIGSDAQLTKFWKERSNDDETIPVTYHVEVSNFSSQDPWQVAVAVTMSGTNFHFHAKLDYDDDRFSALGYCLYVTMIVALQVGAMWSLLKQIQGANPNIANKLSLTTVAFCNIQDFYLTMIHIQYIMESGSNAYLFYVLPSIAYILLFVIFDMKLLFLVWRSHYMRQVDNPQALRKKLTTFYIKFYLGLFVYLGLTYFFNYDQWLIIGQGLLFVPQIVHNVRVGMNPGFQWQYLFGFLALRFLLPFYERSCPDNHFRLAPIVWLVITLAILYVIQIVLLIGQYFFGPRFFIPKFLQPDYYNYQQKIKKTPDNEDKECSICLQSLFVEQNSMNLNSSELQKTILQQKIIMKTPCNHFFHRECLMNWIDVKLECPSCRAVLPPV